MSSERLEQIETLYHAVRELAPSVREGFLTKACEQDQDLYRQVKALLGQDSSGGPLEDPVLSVAARILPDEPITTGSRLGPYEIKRRLGAGGMGAVYQAHDTRIGRTVAIKIAHAEFTGRFLREAVAIAALNHPNICTLYDVGPDYLVMEFLDGETLARRLEKGPLPAAELLRYGSQIADALTAAHAKGIVHRDLKPGNIMAGKSAIKILDFGLARFAEGQNPAASQLPTATADQIIAGTPAYMSPEQLEGKVCDARTDLFALGVILYEMATGRKAFQGDSQAAMIANIMRCEPELADLSPPQFRHLVARCLAKDPLDRWQTARDLKLELDYQQQPVSAAAPQRKRKLWPLVTALVAAVLLTSAAAYFGSNNDEPSVTPLTSYPGSEIQPAISRDGKQVAFAWNGEKETNYNIWVKQIGTSGNPLRLTNGPENDSSPAWSPDGKWVAFLRRNANGADVYVVPNSGGLERRLGASSGNPLVLDWSPDGQWLVIPRFSAPGKPSGLALLSFDTREVRQLSDPELGKSDFGSSFSPKGRALAFLRSGQMMLMAFSESWQPQGPLQPVSVAMGRQIPRLRWTSDGRDLIFSAGNHESSELWRVPVSGGEPKRLTIAGEGASDPAVSARGDRIVFERYFAEYNIWSLQLDEHGRVAGNAVKAFDSSKSENCPRFSPDGSKVAFESGRSGNDEIWVCRSDGSECAQLTSFGDTHAGSPAWSPDGNWIAFDVFRQSRFEIYVINSSGGKPRLLSGGEGLIPHWSRDGKWIFFRCNDQLGAVGNAGLTRLNICRVPAGGGNAEPMTRNGGWAAEMSPDGQWIYYSGYANADSRSTYLRRIPSAGGDPEDVLPSIAGRNFIVLDNGIWYMAPNTPEGSQLQYYDFASKSARMVYRTTKPVSAGLTISPDGRRILFAQIDRSPSYDLMLIEHFH